MERINKNSVAITSTHLSHKKYSSVLFLCLFFFISAAAQKKKPSIPLKDSVDKKFDLSDYVIDAKGFIPVASIITEPALGGFGVVLAPVFINRRPPYVDTINGKVIHTPVQPDITGAVGLFSLNGSWGALAFRSGTLIKSRIKYMIGGGYVDMNISFYKTFPQIGDQEMEFNIKTIPLMMQGIKRIGFSKWYAGLRYIFMDSKITYKGDAKLDSLGTLLESKNILSEASGIIELDSRDNIFTPDKGIKFHVDGGWSNEAIGSDYDFGEINYYSYLYHPLSKKIIGGLRIDGQQSFGSVPFYLLPYIDMRGVPVFRYQGKADILTEVEFRYDFIQRWSIMLYSGLGKAFDAWNEFGSAKWINTVGTGFRYLIARKFKLRMGMDVARGPEKWAYYIVFGSNWLK
jgi:hypothetical protein